MSELIKTKEEEVLKQTETPEAVKEQPNTTTTLKVSPSKLNSNNCLTNL